MTFLGFASNLLSGIIGDKLEKKYPMTKGYLTTISTMISIPLIFLCCLGHGNFWLSTLALSTHILFSGGYHSTAITMVENSVSVSKTSNIVSAWQLYTNLAQVLSPILFSFLGTYLKIS